MHTIRAGVVLTFIALAAGCASYDPYYTPAAELGTEEYRQELAVLAQVCVSTAMTPARLVVQDVSRYGRHGEMRSSGPTSPAKRVNATSANVVFETFTYKRQIDLVGLFVRSGEMDYIYDPTALKLSPETWTPWQSPLSKNPSDEMVWHKLAHQESFQVRPPEPTAPKIRYRLIRNTDWWNDRTPVNEVIPQC